MDFGFSWRWQLICFSGFGDSGARVFPPSPIFQPPSIFSLWKSNSHRRGSVEEKGRGRGSMNFLIHSSLKLSLMPMPSCHTFGISLSANKRPLLRVEIIDSISSPFSNFRWNQIKIFNELNFLIKIFSTCTPSTLRLIFSHLAMLTPTAPTLFRCLSVTRAFLWLGRLSSIKNLWGLIKKEMKMRCML